MATLQDFYHPTLPTNDNYNPINTTEWWAMVFTPSSTYNMTSASFSMRYALSGSSSTVVTMRIRATSGGAPTGPDLASGTASGLTSGFNTFSIPLSSNVTVTSGVQYAMVFSATDNEALGQGQEGGSYTGGNIWSSLNSGSTWSQFLDPAAVQAWFEVYSAPAPTSGFFFAAAAQ